jgi:acyl-coenzyme A synthetase/AMP-(fatty) acid ligase
LINPIEFLFFRERLSPEATAIVTSGRVLSFSQLMRAVRGGCLYLREFKKKQQQDKLIADIKIVDRLDYWIASLSCLHEGITSFTLWPTSNLPEYLMPTFSIAEQNVVGDFNATHLAWPNFDALCSLNADVDYHATDAENIARVFFTSGTSGTSKAITLSYNQLSDRTVIRATNTINFPCALPFISPHSSSGFQTVLKQWALGNSVALANNLDDVLATISTKQVQHLISSPSSLKLLIQQCELKGQYLEVDAMTVLGSAVTLQLFRKLSVLTDATIFSQFGSTETGTCAIKKITTENDLSQFGMLCPGVQVEIVDHNGMPVEAGETGLLRIRTPYMSDAYLSAPSSANLGFYNNWFYSGDLAMFDSVTNDIVLLGKESEVLNIGGAKVLLSQIDDVLISHEYVLDAASYIGYDEYNYPEIYTAITSNFQVDTSVLYDLIESRLGPPCKPKQIVILSEIPRTPSGKPKRALLRELAMTTLKNKQHNDEQL